MYRFIVSIFILFSSTYLGASPIDYVRGYSLTEIDSFYYEANPSGIPTEAQKRVDALYDIGVRHINLHPRAVMKDPRSNKVILEHPSRIDLGKGGIP